MLSRADVHMLAVLGVLWALAVTVFWMAVGWRAMRAHERLAESVDRRLRHISQALGTDRQGT